MRRTGTAQTETAPACRAQSETIGLVLLFGMTFVAISMILVMGTPIIDDARENAQIERIQAEFSTLDQQIRESVYTPSESGASVALDGGVSVTPDSMTVNFTYRNSTDTVTANSTLGSLEYEEASSGVAYQNGGVWAVYRYGSYSMQSEPDISYTGESLTMDLLNFTNAADVSGSDASVSFVSQGTHRSDDLEKITGSPLEDGNLTVTLGSDYAGAWADHLNRTGFDAERPADGKVTAELETGPPLFAVENLDGRYDNTNDEVRVYDSEIGEHDDFNYTYEADGSTVELPGSDDVDECIRTGSGDPLPSPSDTVTAGDYSDNKDIDDHTFDTSDGAIRYFANDSIYLDNISVEGDSPVRIYTEDDVDIQGTVSAEDGQTDLFQIYTSSDNLDVTSGSTYNGTLYAPDADVDIEGEQRGAAIGDDIEVDGEYYHDASLRDADIPDCLDDVPLRNFEAVERKVSVR